jgi:hypothetical protein
MKDSKKKPFFARFLEGQEFPRVKSDLKAGKKPGGPTDPVLDTATTQKYPSDDDEDGWPTE